MVRASLSGNSLRQSGVVSFFLLTQDFRPGLSRSALFGAGAGGTAEAVSFHVVVIPNRSA